MNGGRVQPPSPPAPATRAAVPTHLRQRDNFRMVVPRRSAVAARAAVSRAPAGSRRAPRPGRTGTAGPPRVPVRGGPLAQVEFGCKPRSESTNHRGTETQRRPPTEVRGQKSEDDEDEDEDEDK